MEVIGKARLLWDRYIEYVQKETENIEQHPEESWYLSIRYKVPREVDDIAWRCMRKIGEFEHGPIAIPNEDIVKKIQDHHEYLESIDSKWEILFCAETVAVLRSGLLTVAVPANTVEMEAYTSMDHIPLGQLKRQLIGATADRATGTDLQLLDHMSRSDVTDQLHEQREKIDAKRKEIQNLEKEKQQELERIRQEIEEKYKNYMTQIEEKKAELEEQKEKLENQLYLLDTEIYSIRCYMGEVINFLPITKGDYAQETEPVVIYQKVRYLDEELGKWLSIYGFDGDSENLTMFEKLLAAREDLQEIFAPGKKCVSLLKISKTESYKVDHPMIANTLCEYEKFHGKTIGILIRDCENLWLGWTDQERIQIPDGNAFYRPAKDQIIDEEDMQKNSTKEEVASRYFLFNILRGIIHDHNLLRIPEEMDLNGKNPYIILSMADGWLEDNRYGTFNDIVQRTDRPLMKGDMVLTTLSITRDDYFRTRDDRWNNDRGRGEKNRTHDASIPNRKVVPINLIDTDYIYDRVYRKYKLQVHAERKYVDGRVKEKLITEKTQEFLGYRRFDFTLTNNILGGKKMTKEEVCMYFANLHKNDRADEYVDYHSRDYEGSYYLVYDHTEFVETEPHAFVSAKKSDYNYYGGQTESRANMEIFQSEYLNLTFLNSVYLKYAIQNRKMGGWTRGGESVEYADSIRYLHAALEYIRKREAEEAEMLGKYMELYPDWQVDVSEWRLQHNYHRLTDARAKKFAKEHAKK